MVPPPTTKSPESILWLQSPTWSAPASPQISLFLFTVLQPYWPLCYFSNIPSICPSQWMFLSQIFAVLPSSLGSSLLKCCLLNRLNALGPLLLQILTPVVLTLSNILLTFYLSHKFSGDVSSSQQRTLHCSLPSPQHLENFLEHHRCSLSNDSMSIQMNEATNESITSISQNKKYRSMTSGKEYGTNICPNWIPEQQWDLSYNCLGLSSGRKNKW